MFSCPYFRDRAAIPERAHPSLAIPRFFRFHQEVKVQERRGVGTDLISPEQAIARAVLEVVPDMEELLDPVFADIVGVLLRLGPRQRSAEREQAHRFRAFRSAVFCVLVCRVL